MTVDTLKASVLEGMRSPYNPRTISPSDLSALRRSIREFGMVQPILVNKKTNTIVAGHQRLEAAVAEGLEDLPVIHVDLDKEDERALNLALNRISGEWEQEGLSSLLTEIRAAGRIEVTGFTETEADKIIQKAIDDASPVVPAEEEFSPVIGERQDYIVLAFDTEMDFAAACTLLGVESRYDRRPNGKPWSKGIGRVVNAGVALEKLRGHSSNV